MKPKVQPNKNVDPKAAQRDQVLPKQQKEQKSYAFHDTPEGRLIAQSRIKQCDHLAGQIKNLQDQTKDAARKERLGRRLDRVADVRQALCDNLSGKNLCDMEQMSSRAYSVARKLTQQEMRVGFTSLNERYNKMQTDLEKRLKEAAKKEKERHAKRILALLLVGEYVAAVSATYQLRGEAKAAIGQAIKEAYAIGKNIAASQLGINAPVTPLMDTQLMNIDAADLSDQLSSLLEQTTKNAIRAGVGAGASSEAIVANMTKQLEDVTDRAIQGISGTVTGDWINRGNMSTLMDNVSDIASFQRSEVLDEVTCPMCEDLDGLVIEPDDPFRAMTVVHTHCRGLWVPIFNDDDEKPEVTGIPAVIKRGFDLIDGKPTVNAFKQVRKPTKK